MAKNTLCIDCPYYNNGWCKRRKTNQGLKDLLDCEFKPNKAEKTDNYKVLGKRQLFYTVQRNIEVIKSKTITKQELIELMLTIEQLLQIDEKIFGIIYEDEIDKTIVEDSKNLSLKWKQEIENKGEVK